MDHTIGADYRKVISSRKGKLDLPFVGKLQLKLNHDILRQEIECLLAQREKENLALDDLYSKIHFQELSDEAVACAENLSFSVKDIPPSSRLRGMLNTGSKEYHPYYDERNYTKHTPYVTNVINDVLNSFESSPCRAELLCLKPKDYIGLHHDIGPEFLTRIMIPIITNSEALIGFFRDNKYYEYHLPSDGSIYFVNSGFKHYAVNKGPTARYHMRICLNGQKDISSLEEMRPVRTYTEDEFLKHPCCEKNYDASYKNILLKTLKEFRLEKSGRARLD